MSYRDAAPRKFSFVPGAFSALDALAGDLPVDGVVLDIGVSSMQLDEAARGFSFMRDGPLDMRMASEGDSAADLVNGLEESELANLIYAYGEERKSRRIAHSIVAARATAPITTTAELARLIERAIGRKPGDAHPATRSFQALRIAVNDEFGELVEGLFAAERLLPEGGRLAVVTFHSLEDRIVKRFFEPEKSAPTQSRHLPERQVEAKRWVEIAKARKAGPASIRCRNPARPLGSTLRSARRTAMCRRAASQLRRAGRTEFPRRRMIIRKLNILLMLTSSIAFVAVYGLNYSVEEVAKNKLALERHIDQQKAQLSLLQADWSYLNQPGYIQPIVERHLDQLNLQPIKQAQFGSLTELPMRPVQPDTSAMTALFQSLDAGVDPADKPIGGK